MRRETPARLVRNGVRILVLAYGSSRDHWAEKDRPGIAPLELDLVRADLERWRSEADVLVVSAHWGSMYVDYPPPRVLELGRALAQIGCDLVLGHHPHVLQGFHTYGRTLVLHSLGDACFDSRAGDFGGDDRRRHTTPIRGLHDRARRNAGARRGATQARRRRSAGAR
jgi:poly-gamma-glutamate synthesis protein (capsule biosynthesis protein)